MVAPCSLKPLPGVHTSLVVAASPRAVCSQYCQLPDSPSLFWAHLFQYFAILSQIVFSLVYLQLSALLTFRCCLYIQLQISLPGMLHPPSACPLLLNMLTNSYSYPRHIHKPVINLENSFKMIFKKNSPVINYHVKRTKQSFRVFFFFNVFLRELLGKQIKYMCM